MARPNPNRYTLNAYIDASAKDMLAVLRQAVGVGSDAALVRVALASVGSRFGVNFPVEPGDQAALRALLDTESTRTVSRPAPATEPRVNRSSKPSKRSGMPAPEPPPDIAAMLEAEASGELPEERPVGFAGDEEPGEPAIESAPPVEVARASKPRRSLRESGETPAMLALAAYKRGIESALGSAWAGDAHKGRMPDMALRAFAVHAKGDDGQPLTGDALHAWIEREASAFVRSQPNHTRGYNVFSFVDWLNGGRPAFRGKILPRIPPREEWAWKLAREEAPPDPESEEGKRILAQREVVQEAIRSLNAPKPAKPAPPTPSEKRAMLDRREGSPHPLELRSRAWERGASRAVGREAWLTGLQLGYQARHLEEFDAFRGLSGEALEEAVERSAEAFMSAEGASRFLTVEGDGPATISYRAVDAWFESLKPARSRRPV